MSNEATSKESKIKREYKQEHECERDVNERLICRLFHCRESRSRLSALMIISVTSAVNANNNTIFVGENHVSHVVIF